MLANNLSTDFSNTSPWQSCLRKIYDKIGPASYETWFRTTELLITSDGIARIQVPNQFFADFIEEHFSSLIKESLTESSIQFSELQFVPTQKDWKIIQPLSEEIAEAQTRKIPQKAQKLEQFHCEQLLDVFINLRIIEKLKNWSLKYWPKQLKKCGFCSILALHCLSPL